MYTIPFNNSLWVWFVFAGLSVLAALTVYTKIRFKTLRNCKYLFSRAINKCTNPPVESAKSDLLRFLWIPWIVLCIIFSNCYVSILVSHINVPNSGEAVSNVCEIVCVENDGMNAFKTFPSPFQLKNDDSQSPINQILQLYLQYNNRTGFEHPNWNFAKTSYNRVLNFWKPMTHCQFLEVYSLFKHTSNPKTSRLLEPLVDVIMQYSDGKHLTIFPTHQTDPSCFSLLSSPVREGSNTFSSTPTSFELVETLLRALAQSSHNLEESIAKFL